MIENIWLKSVFIMWLINQIPAPLHLKTCVRAWNIYILSFHYRITMLHSPTSISVVVYKAYIIHLTQEPSSQFSCHIHCSNRWHLKSTNNGGPRILVGMKDFHFPNISSNASILLSGLPATWSWISSRTSTGTSSCMPKNLHLAEIFAATPHSWGL